MEALPPDSITTLHQTGLSVGYQHISSRPYLFDSSVSPILSRFQVKDTLWEGGVRGGALIWSKHLPSSKISNNLMHIQDWLPTILAAVNSTNLKGKWTPKISTAYINKTASVVFDWCNYNESSAFEFNIHRFFFRTRWNTVHRCNEKLNDVVICRNVFFECTWTYVVWLFPR